MIAPDSGIKNGLEGEEGRRNALFFQVTQELKMSSFAAKRWSVRGAEISRVERENKSGLPEIIHEKMDYESKIAKK